MFTYIWESLSPQQRNRALCYAAVTSVCAYLLLTLVAEPLQALQLNPKAPASLFTQVDHVER